MRGPEARALGESSNQRTAGWADSGRSQQGSPHWVQPVSPLPSFLQTPSVWVLSLKPLVTPVIRLPHEECSILPRVYLFIKLRRLWKKLGIPFQPQQSWTPSTTPQKHTCSSRLRLWRGGGV